ncbi:MAG TPA: SAVED domain-containing protein [Clostridia bacterium]|jgi:hypothetical protein|nr:SAVED domain-containing protein [Clostridia bacterium]
MSERKKIKNSVEKMLWAMSAGRCEKCGRLIYQHPLSKVMGNFSQIAHNLPVSDKGKRAEYKIKMISTNMDINDIQNLLLLCYDCHHEIDFVHPEDYPPDVLLKLKNDFEEFVVKTTNIERIIPTLVLKYSPNLHGRKMMINTEIQKALVPKKAMDDDIDLTLKDSSYGVEDPIYWELEEKNLIRSFEKRVIPAIENYRSGFLNISVFAIGPIPLLVKLGDLLSNKQNIDVYQLKKSPATWDWEISENQTTYIVNYIQENKNPKKVILILSLSGQIKKEEVQSVTSWENAIVVEVKPDHEQYDDYLRNKTQLENFVHCYQVLKEDLRKKCTNDTKIHVFAAVPASVAIEIGRHRNNTVDLPLVVYNYTNKKYEVAINIGENNE